MTKEEYIKMLKKRMSNHNLVYISFKKTIFSDRDINKFMPPSKANTRDKFIDYYISMMSYRNFFQELSKYCITTKLYFNTIFSLKVNFDGTQELNINIQQLKNYLNNLKKQYDKE